MEIGSGALTALMLGFLLGLKHATDADHVVAVSTIVSEYRNPWRGLWVGVSWGLGHTTPLLILGTIILLFKDPVAERYEAVAPFLEFGVGIMLVFLGLQVFWNFRRRRVHAHVHGHEEYAHGHVEDIHRDPRTHELSPPPKSHHGFFQPGKPLFRLKSYVVGVVHGLAGSAAVMLLVLTTDVVSSFQVGLLYILLFGLGTVLSMGVITLLMGIPFSISGRFERVNRVIAGVAGTSSIAFGLLLIYELAIVQGL
ncbi:MAG: urease accessory protein UreH [Dehalococcoidia bacterium]|nr:urease accessory protein UreH [Dehalococcoidia bacterium]